MLKLLFNLAVIIIVAYIIYVKFFKKRTVKEEGQGEKKSDALLVSCDKCGTFFETGDKILRDGKQYCSKECAGGKL